MSYSDRHLIKSRRTDMVMLWKNVPFFYNPPNEQNFRNSSATAKFKPMLSNNLSLHIRIWQLVERR